jgi:hypothetical protein
LLSVGAAAAPENDPQKLCQVGIDP